MEFHRVFSPALDQTKAWYAVSLESKDGRIREFVKSEVCRIFSDQFCVLPFASIQDRSGSRVPYDYFGSSRKKDEVVVATAFGLLARSLRSRNLSDGIFHSKVFPNIIESVNGIALEGDVEIPAKKNIKLKATGPIEENKHNSTEINCQQEIKRNFATLKILDEVSVGPRNYMKAASSISMALIKKLREIFHKDGKEIGRIVGNAYLYGQGETDKVFIEELLQSVISTVAEKKSLKESVTSLLGEQYHQHIASFRVPDWVQVYVKLATKLSDKSWQTMLNYLNIGDTGKCADVGLLLTQNKVIASKKMILDITKKQFKVKHVPNVRGYTVSLNEVITWAIRQSRLHGNDSSSLTFNIKLDGRPLAGRDQVSVGIVPIGIHAYGDQSALSVFPLAVANCSENNRDEVRELISRLNEEKEKLKCDGITVDGKKYKLTFKVTLDYKALLKLLVKLHDLKFVLGGRGFDVEFCVFCLAIRACTDHLAGGYDEFCTDCLKSKANIGNWSAIRDDLTFLLEEDLSNVVLCSLHCEMRNTEQLLGSLGLFAFRCDSLEECNESLSHYGPENTQHKDRITINLKAGQQTAVSKSNVSVTSFSGNTERKILSNCESIVDESLPHKKVSSYFESVQGAANDRILSYVSFINEEVEYLKSIIDNGHFTRNYADRQEEISLENNQDLKNFLENKKNEMALYLEKVEQQYLTSCEEPQVSSPPKKKTKKKNTSKSNPVDHHLAELAASIHVDHFKKIFKGWSDIAEIMRQKEFSADQESEIDKFDVKCKLWGRLLRHVFGVTLGCGDYSHLVVDHASMLFRQHRSFKRYSNQGFEASHKVHRALYLRATNHDQSGNSESIEQILTQGLSEMLLNMRLQFVRAKECLEQGKKKFFYRGCGWKSKEITWAKEDQTWIHATVNLLDTIYGNDTLKYEYFPECGTKVTPESDPRVINDESKTPLDDVNQFDVEAATGKRPKCRRRLYKASTSSSGLADSKHAIQSNPSCTQPDVQPTKKSNTNTSDCSSSKPVASTIPSNYSKHSTSSLNSNSNIIDVDAQDNSGVAIVTLPGLHMTRKQFADTPIPPIGMRNNLQQIKVLHVQSVPCSNPDLLHERPGKFFVQKAKEMLRKEGGKCVQLGNYGTFDRGGMDVLDKFCQIADLKKEVAEEETWLNSFNPSLTPYETSLMQNFLWHRSSTATILKAGHKSMDASSLSTLVKERYVDNFLIDTVITKYLEENKSTICAFLPTEAFDWLLSNDHNFIVNKLKGVLSHFHGFQILLLPLHMQHAHWGLIVIDFQRQQVLFDDGFHLDPGHLVMKNVKKIMQYVGEIFSNIPSFDDVNSFHHFGMPSQPSSPAEGSGSCGVGVILSARDIISENSHLNGRFLWSFKDMKKYRKDLLLQIIEWSRQPKS